MCIIFDEEGREVGLPRNNVDLSPHSTSCAWDLSEERLVNGCGVLGII